MVKYRWMLFFSVLSVGMMVKANEMVWFHDNQPVTYSMPKSASTVVRVAAGMFSDDIRQVTGFSAQQTSEDRSVIRIVQLDRADQNVTSEMKSLNVPIGELSKHSDGFFLSVIMNQGRHQLLIVGSNGRGTAYGILELSRMAGVSPWIWWCDARPTRKGLLSVDEKYKTLQCPSVQYRGIFINDEDWSLQPWSWKTFEKGNKPGMIGARTYKEIFKLLLRLRANMIWPAMHGSSIPFYFVPGAKEVADSCGIVIGTSHCEPLLRNNVGEWDVNRRGKYNYVTNRDSVLAYWTERLKETGKYENFYTIGMRGIHDGAMEGVKTMDEKVRTLQQVINDQRNLLSQYINPDIAKVPQVFLPYKEVLQVMEKGLKVPDDVTLMWCDDNYGYMTRLSDEAQQRRSGGSGVYYHLSYWGRPHDYLWMTTTQPGLIYQEMKQAYENNARKIWIVNVHDVKPAAYDLELFLDMAWNINVVSPSTLTNHLQQWLTREFGTDAGTRLLPAMTEYYRLCGIRKPEMMGWNQVELDKKKYERGMSPVTDTEFSLTEFGGEMDRYLQAYQHIKRIVSEVEPTITDNSKDVFFQQIKYPVYCAADMSIKMLEAQRARSLSNGRYDPSLWVRTDDLRRACAKSLNAYHEINTLTDYYNNQLAGGKWKYSMCSIPRDLFVFYAPHLPLSLTDTETEQCLAGIRSLSSTVPEVKTNDCVARNACDYQKASDGVFPVQMLGHSMKAVSLPKGSMLTYHFNCDFTGDVVLRTAVIPTQPNDQGDIRIRVSIDGDKPQTCSYRENGRTEQWKLNVMRGQAICATKHILTAGKHTLTITALDNHVVIDQWMVDKKADRKFYLFPVKND